MTHDPGASDKDAQQGSLKMNFGEGWSKAQSFATGQTPVMRYHHKLMQMILNDKAHIADAVNATIIGLEDAPKGYKDFDSGVSKKFVLDPHGMLQR